ncbi:Protein of unknown function (DUF3592) [Actinokineospora globicatena]|uniref:DUF3592 domain-containing protein n=2 Tax=Actinokineospora globicatena TaxID=103729 RepID=UPI0024A08120|nr:Protein of unknown function (DUF3592) [Actinokineospora globicatena]GLW78022.1 hypothetical protein Aglo01_25040 [Actinokineospora globicatena]GLW85312.1 hypothetical protein Aglo02_29520 [Actinokineospora globicatena]
MGMRGAGAALVGAVALVAVAMVPGAVLESESDSLTANAVETSAVVFEIREHSRGEDSMRVRYSADGVDREQSLRLDKPYTIGEQVRVIYDRTDPDRVAVVGVEYESPFTVLMVVLLGGAAALVVVAVVLAINGLRDVLAAGRVNLPGRHRVRKDGDGRHSR